METTTTTFARIKRITSHVGKSRYLATVTDAGWIPRQMDIPSPYMWSPTHAVYNDHTTRVIIVETAHKRYDVFAVPATTPIFATDDEAATAFLTMRVGK